MKRSSLTLWVSSAVIWGIIGCGAGEQAAPSSNLAAQWHNHLESQINDLTLIRDPDDRSIALNGRKLSLKEALLGMSRVVRVADQPRAHLPGHQDREQIKGSFEAQEIGGMMMVYGSKTSPLTFDNFRRSDFGDFISFAGGPSADWLESELYVQGSDLVHETLQSGRDQNLKSGEIEFFTKTIRLNQAECLSCHSSSKLNDPAGVAVYALAKTDMESRKRRSSNTARYRTNQSASPRTTPASPRDTYVDRLHGFYADLIASPTTLNEAMLMSASRRMGGVTEGDVRGIFGASRIYRFAHEGVMITKNNPDRDKMNRLISHAKELGLKFRVQMFGAGSRALTKNSATRVPWSDQVTTKREPVEFSNAEKIAAAQLARRALETSQDQLLTEGVKEMRTRTIRLNDTKCLACHTESFRGDPAAVMVYISEAITP